MTNDAWVFVMMKIGALDVNWWGLPLDARLRRIAELGFEGVEFWLTLRELGFSESVVITEWPEKHTIAREYLTPRRFAKIVEEAGLEAQSFGQFNILGPQPSTLAPTIVVTGKEMEERLREIKGLMEFAAEADVKTLICDSGGDPDKPEQWKPFLEAMNDLTDHAEKTGVVLAMENTPQNLVADDDGLLRLMKEIPSKALRVHFDPANLHLCPWRGPPANKDVPKAIKKLKKYIVSAHAKDGVWHYPKLSEPPDVYFRSCPVMGQGTTPWQQCIEAFKEIGYNGYLIVEYFAPGRSTRPQDAEKGMIENKKYLENLMAKIYK